MRCFYHHEKEAVGTCKSCGKGLCPDCAVDLGKGLACRGHCEEDAKAMIQLIERSIKFSPKTENFENIVQTGRRARTSGAIMNIILGIIFMVWGISMFHTTIIIFIMGVCFMAFGVYAFLKCRIRKE